MTTEAATQPTLIFKDEEFEADVPAEELEKEDDPLMIRISPVIENHLTAGGPDTPEEVVTDNAN